MTLAFAGPALRLTGGDTAAAAQQLGVEPALIRAVDEVESRGAGFLDDGRPKILFERHIFSRRAAHRFDASHPGISNPVAGGYGAGGEHQYDRLAEAIALDRKAALEAASWGRYQVMGFNAELCGWRDVEDFVASMMQSEAEHLKAFIGYCRANNLTRFLITHDWRSFTRGYNGPGNVDDYAQKLATAYRKHAAVAPAPAKPVPQSAGAPPVETLKAIQVKLKEAGYYVLHRKTGKPLLIDGDFGEQSRAGLDELLAAAGQPRL